MSNENSASTSITGGITIEPGDLRYPFKPQVTAGEVSVSRNTLGITLERVLNGHYDLHDERDREYIRKTIEQAKKDSVIEIGRPAGWVVGIHFSGTEHVTPGAPWIVLVRKADEP